MKTRCIAAVASGAIEEAADLLCEGSVVAFPTETVYGLGGNALSAEASRRIFEAKGRPADNPLIAHISEMDMLQTLVEAPGGVFLTLAEHFWPGPLTLIAPKKPQVPRETTGGLNTVAVRMPDHDVARALIRRCGFPLAAPSANRSGRPSPTRAADVMADMDGRIPLVLDGGACRVGLESTVVDTRGAVPVILRPGGVTREQMAAVLGVAPEVHASALQSLGEGEAATSPGMKYKHYAPCARVVVVRGGAAALRRAYDEAERAGERPLLLCGDGSARENAPRAAIALGKTAEEYAAHLFTALREADVRGATVVFAEAIEAKGVALAYMNRVLRAAGFATM